MPTRLLRDGILTSEAVCSLGWAEEVFYRRLMSAVDDHGRFHALPKLLRAALYPLQIDKVSDADIGKWIAACEKAALVSVYPASDGKRYLQIVKFGQKVRSKSKYPEPVGVPLLAIVSNGEQLPANVHLDVCECEVECVCGLRGPGKQLPDPESPAIERIPLADGSDFPVTEAMVAEFDRCYPAVDVPQTLREIRAWCVANPKNRKTKTGAMRFINAWLSREQNKPAARA